MFQSHLEAFVVFAATLVGAFSFIGLLLIAWLQYREYRQRIMRLRHYRAQGSILSKAGWPTRR